MRKEQFGQGLVGREMVSQEKRSRDKISPIHSGPTAPTSSIPDASQEGAVVWGRGRVQGRRGAPAGLKRELLGCRAAGGKVALGSSKDTPGQTPWAALLGTFAGLWCSWFLRHPAPRLVSCCHTFGWWLPLTSLGFRGPPLLHKPRGQMVDEGTQTEGSLWYTYAEILCCENTKYLQPFVFLLQAHPKFIWKKSSRSTQK